MEVFQLIGEGLPIREIAERLFLSLKAIETHLD
jgi:DNA-binding NarL/FixJ family response regulator